MSILIPLTFRVDEEMTASDRIDHLSATPISKRQQDRVHNPTGESSASQPLAPPEYCRLSELDVRNGGTESARCSCRFGPSGDADSYIEKTNMEFLATGNFLYSNRVVPRDYRLFPERDHSRSIHTAEHDIQRVFVPENGRDLEIATTTIPITQSSICSALTSLGLFAYVHVTQPDEVSCVFSLTHLFSRHFLKDVEDTSRIHDRTIPSAVRSRRSKPPPITPPFEC
jgi:hypothetical protein